MNAKFEKLAREADIISSPSFYTGLMESHVTAVKMDNFAARIFELAITECRDAVNNGSPGWITLNEKLSEFQLMYPIVPVPVITLHLCPYLARVNGNHKAMCNCNAEEMQLCVNDIPSSIVGDYVTINTL